MARFARSVVGLIQKVLVDLVLAKAGEEGVAELKRRAGIPQERRFRIDTVYSDDECMRLLGAAAEVLKVDATALEVLYADWFARDAMKRWPVWFEMSATAKQFLERQQTIHNTFATGVRDPEARKGIRDKFRIERAPHGLVTHYRSPNELCGLYKALARWVLDHYRDTATIEEPHCMKRGDAECEIHIRWPEAKPA
jgi:hypothetical protein